MRARISFRDDFGMMSLWSNSARFFPPICSIKQLKLLLPFLFYQGIFLFCFLFFFDLMNRWSCIHLYMFLFLFLFWLWGFFPFLHSCLSVFIELPFFFSLLIFFSSVFDYFSAFTSSL